MREKRSESDEMTTAAPFDEMHDLVRRAAGPHAPWKIRVRVAARTIGISFSRAKDFYYRNPKARVWPEELERARRAAQTLKPVGAGHHGSTDTPAALAGRLRRLMDEHERLGREIAEMHAALDGAGDGGSR